MAEFNVGDVVQLKSGGPLMTVTAVGELFGSKGIRISCTWFDEKGSQKSANFEPLAIEPIET